ncbi:Gasdermin-E [Manis pentadactyla]|nr:Gasdermin-E [Manis pentadactyla]
MRTGCPSATAHQLRTVAGVSGAGGCPRPEEEEAEEVRVAAALRFAAGRRCPSSAAPAAPRASWPGAGARHAARTPPRAVLAQAHPPAGCVHPRGAAPKRRRPSSGIQLLPRAGREPTSSSF